MSRSKALEVTTYSELHTNVSISTHVGRHWDLPAVLPDSPGPLDFPLMLVFQYILVYNPEPGYAEGAGGHQVQSSRQRTQACDCPRQSWPSGCSPCRNSPSPWAHALHSLVLWTSGSPWALLGSVSTHTGPGKANCMASEGTSMPKVLIPRL